VCRPWLGSPECMYHSLQCAMCICIETYEVERSMQAGQGSVWAVLAAVKTMQACRHSGVLLPLPCCPPKTVTCTQGLFTFRVALAMVSRAADGGMPNGAQHVWR
jgi:hypothetical protein